MYLLISELEIAQFREYVYIDVVPLKCRVHSCASVTDFTLILEFTGIYPLVICLTSSNF